MSAVLTRMAVFSMDIACVVACLSLALPLSTWAESAVVEGAGQVLKAKSGLHLANGTAQTHTPAIPVLNMNMYCNVLHCIVLHYTMLYGAVPSALANSCPQEY